jgi:hypothetical protein
MTYRRRLDNNQINERESSASLKWQLKLDFYFLPDIPFDLL